MFNSDAPLRAFLALTQILSQTQYLRRKNPNHSTPLFTIATLEIETSGIIKTFVTEVELIMSIHVSYKLTMQFMHASQITKKRYGIHYKWYKSNTKTEILLIDHDEFS